MKFSFLPFDVILFLCFYLHSILLQPLVIIAANISIYLVADVVFPDLDKDTSGSVYSPHSSEVRPFFLLFKLSFTFTSVMPDTTPLH